MLRLLGKAFTRKTDGIAEKTSCQQTTLCDIQINIKYHIYLYVELPCRSPKAQNTKGIDFELFTSLKAGSDGTVGLPIYEPISVNSNIWPNSVLYEA